MVLPFPGVAERGETVNYSRSVLCPPKTLEDYDRFT